MQNSILLHLKTVIKTVAIFHNLHIGKGDMLVWAYKDGKSGYKKVSFTKDDRTVGHFRYDSWWKEFY